MKDIHELLKEINLKIDCSVRGCIRAGEIFERTPGFRDHLGVKLYWKHVEECPNKQLLV